MSKLLIANADDQNGFILSYYDKIEKVIYNIKYKVIEKFTVGHLYRI